MARSKSTLLDNARQQITRIMADRRKAEARARVAKKKAQAKNELRDIAAKARALKKLGLYNPKEPIKQSTLTKSKKRTITKAFNKLQRHSKFIEKGFSVRPLVKIDKVNKAGRIVSSYKLSDYFKLFKTKKKTNAISGVVASRKGILVEKDTVDSVIRINKDGDLVQSRPSKSGKRIITRRKGVKGKKIIKLVEDIESGKIKLKKNQHLIYNRYGWKDKNNTRAFDYDELDLFVSEFYNYQREMPPAIFNGWLDASELSIRDN